MSTRYYSPNLGRFLNADAFTSTGQGLLGNNTFAYCLNNPVALSDPTGELAITISTLILIGSAVVGVACAGYTAYTTYKAGWDVADIIFHSIGAGLCGFSVVYTLGMSAYQLYLNYCMLQGISPVTEVTFGASDPTKQLQACADSANAQVSGVGPTTGTKKHTIFANEVNALGNSSLATEISYKDGSVVPYGTTGSIRFDVIRYDSMGNPLSAWDFKTGSATLTASRIATMQARSGLNITIYEIR